MTHFWLHLLHGHDSEEPHHPGDWTTEILGVSPAPGVVVTVSWRFVDDGDAQPSARVNLAPGADPAPADEVLSLVVGRPGPKEIIDRLRALGYAESA